MSDQGPASPAVQSRLDELVDERERGAIADAPAFTVDDLIQFHFLLQDDRYVQDFFASSDGV